MNGRIFFLVLFDIVVSVPTGVYVGKDGNVGASFGGYSASAGLGGLVTGAGTRGNIHAEAGTPHGHYAAAGLGGSVSENSGAQGQLHSHAGLVGGGSQPLAPVPNNQASSSAFASSSGSSAQGNGAIYGNNRPQNSIIDDIFNIPIATLGAVNQYLNNRNKGVHVQPNQRIATNSAASASSSASASGSTSFATSDSSSGSGHGVGGGNNKNYNDIFNV